MAATTEYCLAPPGGARHAPDWDTTLAGQVPGDFGRQLGIARALYIVAVLIDLKRQKVL